MSDSSQIDKVWQEGFEAFQCGILRDDNPYRGVSWTQWADGWDTAQAKFTPPPATSKLVMENYNEELEKTVARMNAEGKADQVVQFLRYYEDHDNLCRTGHWTTVILRVPA